MAGTPGACSQVFCHPIKCMPVMRYRQRYVINTQSEPPPPPSRLNQVAHFLLISRWSCSGCHGKPWRTRRLREAEEVATAPSVATPRADDRRDGCGRSDSPLSSTETEDCHSHQGSSGRTLALRAQITPPPGVRPGLPPEPGPQRSDRSLRRSAGDAPPLTVPVLAAAADEAVDSATLSFLVQRALEVNKKEEEAEKKEEEAKKRKREELRRRQRRQELKREFLDLVDLPSPLTPLQHARMQELADILESEEHPAASSGARRKRKKRRRKRTRRSRPSGSLAVFVLCPGAA